MIRRLLVPVLQERRNLQDTKYNPEAGNSLIEYSKKHNPGSVIPYNEGTKVKCPTCVDNVHIDKNNKITCLATNGCYTYSILRKIGFTGDYINKTIGLDIIYCKIGATKMYFLHNVDGIPVARYNVTAPKKRIDKEGNRILTKPQVKSYWLNISEGKYVAGKHAYSEQLLYDLNNFKEEVNNKRPIIITDSFRSAYALKELGVKAVTTTANRLVFTGNHLKFIPPESEVIIVEASNRHARDRTDLITKALQDHSCIVKVITPEMMGCAKYNETGIDQDIDDVLYGIRIPDYEDDTPRLNKWKEILEKAVVKGTREERNDLSKEYEPTAINIAKKLIQYHGKKIAIITEDETLGPRKLPKIMLMDDGGAIWKQIEEKNNGHSYDDILKWIVTIVENMQEELREKIDAGLSESKMQRLINGLNPFKSSKKLEEIIDMIGSARTSMMKIPGSNWKDVTIIPRKKIDKAANRYIGADGKVIDMIKGEVVTDNPLQYFVTRSVPTEFDPEADKLQKDGSRLSDFPYKHLGKGVSDFIWKVRGSWWMYGPQQKAIFFIGKGSTGKTSTREMFDRAWGSDNGYLSLPSKTSLDKDTYSGKDKPNPSGFDFTDPYREGAIVEIEDGLKDLTMFKTYSGGDSYKVRYLNHNPVTVKATIGIIVYCNDSSFKGFGLIEDNVAMDRIIHIPWITPKTILPEIRRMYGDSASDKDKERVNQFSKALLARLQKEMAAAKPMEEVMNEIPDSIKGAGGQREIENMGDLHYLIEDMVYKKGAYVTLDNLWNRLAEQLNEKRDKYSEEYKDSFRITLEGRGKLLHKNFLFTYLKKLNPKFINARKMMNGKQHQMILDYYLKSNKQKEKEEYEGTKPTQLPKL